MNRKHFFAAVILLSLLVMGLQLAYAEVEPTVTIDIRPNDSDNIVNINPSSHGVVPVAIYGNSTVDVTLLTSENIESIYLTDNTQVAQVHLRGNDIPLYQIKDLDNDENLDLVVYIDVYNFNVEEGEVPVFLYGPNVPGAWIVGKDFVNIVPSN